jgi:signal transduction histidine kinase
VESDTFSKFHRLVTVRRGIGLRLAVAYSAVLVLNMLGLFALAYALMSTYLHHADHDLIRHRLGELAARYEREGLDGLTSAIGNNRRSFLVRVAAADGETLLLVIPDKWGEFNLKRLGKLKTGSAVEWLYIPARGDEDVLEVAGIGLGDGRSLLVGRSSGHRGAILERFLLIVGLALIPVGVFAFWGGTFLAARALRPLRTFVQTIRAIEVGAIDARIPDRRTEDELEELSAVFNRLLDRNAALIQGMRGALDNVAHDLRTPISRIRGAAEISLRSEEEGAHLREALADCVEEADRLLTMLNTLMDISEAETGALKLNLEAVSLSALVREVVDVYSHVADDRGLTVVTRVPEHLWLTVDRARIRQVLGNLLDNGLKYTPRGGWVAIEAFRESPTIVVVVRDNGVGIPAQDLQKIWDRLYRGDQSRSQRGLGLGLSLVKAFVRAHGGDVEVQSRPGEGSTFRLLFRDHARPGETNGEPCNVQVPNESVSS